MTSISSSILSSAGKAIQSVSPAMETSRSSKMQLCPGLRAVVLACSLILVVSTLAIAVPLNQALTPRPTSQNIAAGSYDGAGFDPIDAFAGFVASQNLAVGSFTGGANGAKLETFLFNETACYDGRFANMANNFGVTNQNGDFISLIDSANAAPGAMGMTMQGPGDEFTFALQSPEALFSADDSQNSDGAVHIIGREVENEGTVSLPATLTGNRGPGISFDLKRGDIVLFIEDMLASGNSVTNMVPFLSDFDYNDMIIIVRQTEVPEPGTVALLGAGLIFLRRRKS